mmetsp:Transcript_13937/g.20801  ORF Transcript_13937/g.20801 Transcript_13937/m.20801 type:complete len:276 (-) Transcript_13937:101-928(-)|eukprot:CAMPEP_0194094226 /NCGR_PEP_ID=MMETSP0149-20130528/53242_1 /TAXON_ID=122233 /ORGANISM="Chaetoceros debilis, Strain MM31A-1" /LENGTH=275 /DNA_ID=CAMNT_0038779805 /DNA_START=14 /DNA_END=841 /DNA_ORIENTATION=+
MMKSGACRVVSRVKCNQSYFPSRTFRTSTANKEQEPFYGSPRENKKTPLSPFQNLSLAVYSATSAFLDPEKHEMVATLSEVTGHVALQNMYNDMMTDPTGTGQRILSDRPLVDIDKNTSSSSKIDMDALQSLDKNTFGHSYFKFLKKHKFDPNERAEVKYIADEELAYVMKRYRQSHDFYHVLTDLPPSVPGELALKYVELFQTGLPVCALSATFGSFKLNSTDRQLWRDAYLPWAIRVGNNGKKWINVYWEEEFEKDLDQLRTELGVEVAPTLL